VRAFGFGLGYTTFDRTELRVDEDAPTNGVVRASVLVRNTGRRAGSDLVQLYGHDVVASVTRPVAQLLGYVRVDLEPGEEARVAFDVPSARLGFTNRDFVRVVEPGDVELWVGGSCAHKQTTASVRLTGGDYLFGSDAPAVTTATIRRDR
jgi:beta-glucosidase